MARPPGYYPGRGYGYYPYHPYYPYYGYGYPYYGYPYYGGYCCGASFSFGIGVGFGYPAYAYPYAYGAYPYYGGVTYTTAPPAPAQGGGGGTGDVNATHSVEYGGVRIQNAPRDAQVYVDGYYSGIVDDFDGSGQHMNLSAGVHKVEIHITGQAPIEFDVNVQPGQTITYRVGPH
ncbi:MAG TPA: hypothetical protein VH583_20340 [Vicinamibacterales bacterium]